MSQHLLLVSQHLHGWHAVYPSPVRQKVAILIFHLKTVDVRRLQRTEESLRLVPVTRSSSREGWVCFQLTDRASPSSPQMGNGPAVCLLPGKEKHPSSLEQRPQGRGLACVYSLSWPGKLRRGRSVSAVAASSRGLWETSVWRAGGAPAVSGVDNELQVLQWVV